MVLPIPKSLVTIQIILISKISVIATPANIVGWIEFAHIIVNITTQKITATNNKMGGSESYCCTEAE